MIENAVEFEQRLRSADRRDILKELVRPELEYYQSNSKEYRCYQTHRCLLCKKKVDHTKEWKGPEDSPFDFHIHALEEGHIQKYLELGNAWARYREDLDAATKGARIEHKSEVLNDFIEILSAITRHKAWITEVAGQLFMTTLRDQEIKKKKRRKLFVSIINRIYKKEVLALVLLAYIKCKVTCNNTLTMHEVRVPDSRFGSVKPFYNLFTGLSITSGHIIVNRVAPFITEICDVSLYSK